jgi:hypothetical protein
MPWQRGLASSDPWERLAVLPEDFERFDLLPLQPKKHPNLRRFLAQGYHDCTELDAIPAPALRDLVRAAIEQHAPGRRVGAAATGRSAGEEERRGLFGRLGEGIVMRELVAQHYFQGPGTRLVFKWSAIVTFIEVARRHATPTAEDLISKRRRQRSSGCSFENHEGRLRLRFRVPGRGQRARTTGLLDTPGNRQRLECAFRPW